MKNKKTIIGIILLSVGVVALFSGFLISKMSKQEEKSKKEQEERAIVEARNYIKTKYGFDLEITKISTQLQYNVIGPSGTYSTTTIEAKHDDKTYYVKVSLEPEHPNTTMFQTTIVYDTYQNSKISEKISQELEKIFNEKPYYFYSDLENPEKSDRRYYGNEFTGKTTSGIKAAFVAAYINNTNFNNTAKINFRYSFTLMEEAYVYNFKSKEDYNKVKNIVENLINVDIYKTENIKRDYEAVAIYLDDILVTEFGTTEVLYKVNVEDKDDIIFVEKNHSTNTISNIEFNKQSLSKKGNNYVKKQFGNNYNVIESYNVGNNEMKESLVYLKKEKYTNKNLKAVLYCSNNIDGKERHKQVDFKNVGDYYYATFNSGLYCKDDLFYLVIGK